MKRNLTATRFLSMLIFGATATLAAPADAMQINVTYDSTVTSLSNATQFENAFDSVVSQFQSAITNSATIAIQVSVGKISSSVPLPSGAVSGSFDPKTAMGSTAAASFANTTAALSGTGAVLPGTSPTGSAVFYMPQAEVKALGLPAAIYPTANAFDGFIGFTSTMSQLSFSGTPTSTQYSFQTAAMHEIQEVLGRTSFLNNAGTIYQSFATPIDLFRYAAAGVSSYTQNTANGGTPAYASIDGGVTDLGTFADQTTTGDRTDWQTPVNTTSTDAQNALLSLGVNQGLSISDEDVLKALGYRFASNNGNGLFSGVNAPVGATASVNASQPVPEPTSLALLAAFAALAGLTCRRAPRSVLAG